MRTPLLIVALAVAAGCAGPTMPAVPQLASAAQIPVGKAPHGIGEVGGFIYNSNTGDGTVSAIEAGSATVVTTFKLADNDVASKPGYVKGFHDGRHGLILDTRLGMLAVVDPAQDHRVVQTLAVGGGPDKIVVGEDDKQVLISLTNEPKLVLLTFGEDRAQPPARREFNVGTVTGEGHRHRAVAMAKGWAVAPSNGENQVQLIDLGTGAVNSVAAGTDPGPVAVGTTDGRATVAIVGNKASHTLTIYDLPSGAATTLSGVGLTPTEIAIDAPLGRAFVTMAGSNELAIVDYRSKQLLTKLPTGKRPVHVYLAPPLAGAGESHEVWVGNDDGASVSIFDGAAMKPRAVVATGEGHHKMAFVGSKGFVSNITAGTVSVVDRTQLP